MKDENKEQSACPIKADDDNQNSYLGYLRSFFYSSPQSGPAGLAGYNAEANDAHFDHSRLYGQKEMLSVKRATSSIPKGDFSPVHQPTGSEKWVYPSEQQYYNAMKRKGYDPQEKDVPIVLAIHNLVNEKGWADIKQWEQIRGSHVPKLKKFLGRPKDISPKARLLNFFGYSLPFDRHDWIIDRNGEEVRYVIDFYKGHQAQGSPISIHLDVRPALDSFPALFDRIYVSVKDRLNCILPKEGANRTPPEKR